MQPPRARFTHRIRVELEGVTVCPVPRLFLPQPLFEEWLADDRADLKEGRLVVPSEQASYPATPAVLFLKLVSGVDDKHLLAKVKTEEQLRSLGGEQLADSVLLGENAYEVIPGYLTEVAGEKGKPAQETDLLAAYLLDKIGS